MVHLDQHFRVSCLYNTYMHVHAYNVIPKSTSEHKCLARHTIGQGLHELAGGFARLVTCAGAFMTHVVIHSDHCQLGPCLQGPQCASTYHICQVFAIIYIVMHIYIYTCMHVCTHIYRIHACIYIYICIYEYIHTYIVHIYACFGYARASYVSLKSRRPVGTHSKTVHRLSTI